MVAMVPKHFIFGAPGEATLGSELKPSAKNMPSNYTNRFR